MKRKSKSACNNKYMTECQNRAPEYLQKVGIFSNNGNQKSIGILCAAI